MGMYPCRPGYIVALSLCFAAYIVNLVINSLASSPHPPLFYNSTGDVSRIYYLDITPAGWAFSIWGIIYIWQVVWFGYAFSTLCRPGVDGYLYYSPTLLPVSIYIIYIFNLVDLVSWLIVWDRSANNTTYIVPAAVIILLAPFFGFLCLLISIRALTRNLVELYQNGMMKEAWMIRFMFQNGIACYTTWVCIAALLNFAMLLHYYFAAVNVYVAGSISLAILSCEVITWFVLDIFFWDRYTRYLFAPYAVLVWALSGAVDKNYPVDQEMAAPEGDRSRNPYWLIALLSLSCVLLVVKITLLVYRSVKYPLPSSHLYSSASREDLRGGYTYQGYGSVEPPAPGGQKETKLNL